MSYFCDICDETIKVKSKSEHLKSIIHKELEKSFHIVYSIDDPKFFDVDDIYITILLTFTIKNIIFIMSNVILI